MVNEFIFKDLLVHDLRDLKKSDNRPYKLSPNTDVSVAENGPMLSNHRPIHFLITFILK